MLTHCSWAIHRSPKSFFSHTASWEAPGGACFGFHALHQDVLGICGWGDCCMGAAPIASLGFACTSHLFRTETQKSERKGDKLQHLLLTCSPGLLFSVLNYCPFTWNTADVKEGPALLCSTCWTCWVQRCSAAQAQTWPGLMAPADVPALQGSGTFLGHFPTLLLPPCKSQLSWPLETGH